MQMAKKSRAILVHYTRMKATVQHALQTAATSSRSKSLKSCKWPSYSRRSSIYSLRV